MFCSPGKVGCIIRIRKCLSILRVIPISSAQALTIPALLALKLLWILNRKGSIALLKRMADPGQPCSTPERKLIKLYVVPLCVKTAFAP